MQSNVISRNFMWQALWVYFSLFSNILGLQLANTYLLIPREAEDTSTVGDHKTYYYTMLTQSQF